MALLEYIDRKISGKCTMRSFWTAISRKFFKISGDKEQPKDERITAFSSLSVDNKYLLKVAFQRVTSAFFKAPQRITFFKSREILKTISDHELDRWIFGISFLLIKF